MSVIAVGPGVLEGRSEPAYAPQRAVPQPPSTSSGFAAWIYRIVSLGVLTAIFPTLMLAYHQLGRMHIGWLMGVAGGILAASILMPIYAWSDRGIRLPAALYALDVFLGLLTWQGAWSGGEVDPNLPWLWLCVASATICVAAATSDHRIALAYASVVSALFLWVRLSPSGGAASVVLAVQDTLMMLAQPVGFLLVLHYTRRAVNDLDDSLSLWHHERVDAAMMEALVDERSRLDGIVHDEVMTTLVAAARSVGPDHSTVVAQASHALDSLRAADHEASSAEPVVPDQFVWLIADVVASVNPTAEVKSRVMDAAVRVPHDVVRALAQAVREASLNAAKHAQAASVHVDVEVGTTRGRPFVAVAVIDDGVGFDVDAVPAQRLGIRVSLASRLRSIGGQAEVSSEPGAGTRVDLTWTGAAALLDTAHRPLRDHPLFATLKLEPYAWSAGAIVAFYVTVGILSLSTYDQPGLALAGIGLALGGMASMVVRLGQKLAVWHAWAASAAAVATGALCVAAMPPGPWSDHALWFVGVVAMMLCLVRVGGHAVPAWSGAIAYAIVVLTGAHLSAMDVFLAFGAALSPVVWLGVLALMILWLHRVHGELVEARRSSAEAASAGAAAFSKLVLRDVWLADIIASVGPLLERLARPGLQLTDADRELCLFTEDALRDGIKATNLKSPVLTAAIMEARRRGVRVTLVDNRGSALPVTARRAALRHLETVIRGMTSGHLVARTAPEGYDEAVTIVEVDPVAGSSLTTITHDGAIARA